MSFEAQLDKVRTRPGFIAALDQSGGSTPKALGLYGIAEDAWSNDDEMFTVVHQMRTRIMTSPAFTGDRILGAILFELISGNPPFLADSLSARCRLAGRQDALEVLGGYGLCLAEDLALAQIEAQRHLAFLAPPLDGGVQRVQKTCIAVPAELDAVARFDEPLVKALQLFDVFVGDPIPAGKKSISFRVVYQADDRTLEDETVNTIHRNLTHRLIAEFDAALPA